VAAGVFSGASPDLAQAARLETRPLRIQSDFQHFPPTGPSYATRITGVLDLHFAAATDGTAQATAVLRKGSCFATVGWSVASMPPGHTAPAEVCLAHDAADESGFNAWMAAQTGTDPSLVIALSGSGMPPTAWSNPSPVPVRLFLRGCGVDLYRPLARLLVPPGGLIVQTFTDPDGDAQLGLAAMSVALVDVTPTVWADVLMGCGGAAAGLPTAPALGMSTQFIATTDTPSDDPSRPHVQIALIKDAVEDLVETQALSAGKGRALVRKLDGSVKKLRQAKPDKAIRRLDRFQTLTTVFEQRGFLSMTAGAMLRAQAAGAAAGILMITIDGTAGPPDPSLFCDPAPAVCPSLGSTYTTYYVRAFAGIGLVPDGSAARPYRTIVDALDAAQANALPGVELLVAGGLYSGDLLITRNTRIIGDARGNPVIEGSIISDGAYRLVLQDVRIIPDAGVGISVDNPCAETRVDGVRVENATGYGILQRGGSIEIADTLVDATQSEDVNLTRGTGIYLTCGVDAQVDDVILTNNESAALVVIGEDTTAEGADLRVVGTGVHPLLAADLCVAPAVLGAVQVRLGARAEFDVFYISDNDVIGLLVAGADAGGQPSEATFRDGTVTQTNELTGDCAGGTNVMVIDAGTLLLSNFNCTQADLCGLFLARDGEADLFDGTVSDNLIGACIQSVDFDLSRLQNEVRYIDNGRNLDSVELPIPEPVGDVGP
jgi:hypothetical protein